MKNLKSARKKIDSIDKRIILLLSERFGMAKGLKRLKKQQNLRIRDRAREKEVIDNARTMAKQHDIKPEFAEELFKKIVRYTRQKQR
ncbi:chorismate mutase [Candidatus Woesearchaeota archaeon CG10_big_fil_rev_8_21_14_0_10_44_13]|nr:MAG: chorismate mutase [Candidatus Woesearchaeota archaeon CG10_big_fil_rev_8_21_14_0_10_44_13]